MTQTNGHEPGASTQLATLGGGCFWCLEAVYVELNGVDKVVSGYAGGSGADPTYLAVSRGATGHAEVVQVTFDPGVISFREILDVFFTIHDPTTLDRQGGDVGTQYRSAIFHHDEAQKAAAERTKAARQDSGKYTREIVTEITPAGDFWLAEDYHQQFFEKRGHLRWG